jgi:hypothetical protein
MTDGWNMGPPIMTRIDGMRNLVYSIPYDNSRLTVGNLESAPMTKVDNNRLAEGNMGCAIMTTIRRNNSSYELSALVRGSEEMDGIMFGMIYPQRGLYELSHDDMNTVQQISSRLLFLIQQHI